MFNPLRLSPEPIHFGTDGWRGVLGVDITIERLLPVAAAAAKELAYRAPRNLNSNQVIIGYDCRFLAPELAEAVASVVANCDLVPLLTKTPVPTPSCSWSVVKRKALGALVITASHNPPEWIGLKIKGPFGGSVDRSFTASVEKRISSNFLFSSNKVSFEKFDAREEHLNGIKKKFDISSLAEGFKALGLKVIVDSMHGSAAGCIKELFDPIDSGMIEEIRSNRDPLFGGNPPEPLECYIGDLISAVKLSNKQGKPSIGIVFDGDGDRIAAVDEFGNYCSNQLLIPLLIDHLARVRKLPGCVIKTVSGSDLMRLVGESLGREVLELPVGFKYIAKEMLSRNVLIGGEESGGIGFGMHLPERDALFAALLILEAVQSSGKPLGLCLKTLVNKYGASQYERLDLRLSGLDMRNRLEETLMKKPPSSIGDIPIKEITSIDGIKFRLAKNYWLMFRFSGTEPLLRIYCEAPTDVEVKTTLTWASEYIQSL